MKKEKLDKILGFLILILLFFFFLLLMIRILTYTFITPYSITFVNIEVILYTIGVLFILKMMFLSPEQIKNIFFAPLTTQKVENALYRKRDIYITVVLFIFSLIYLLVNFNKGMPNMDEGFILAISERTLKGEIPHKIPFLALKLVW